MAIKHAWGNDLKGIPIPLGPLIFAGGLIYAAIRMEPVMYDAQQQQWVSASEFEACAHRAQEERYAIYQRQLEVQQARTELDLMRSDSTLAGDPERLENMYRNYVHFQEHQKNGGF